MQCHTSDQQLNNPEIFSTLLRSWWKSVHPFWTGQNSQSSAVRMKRKSVSASKSLLVVCYYHTIDQVRLSRGLKWSRGCSIQPSCILRAEKRFVISGSSRPSKWKPRKPIASLRPHVKHKVHKILKTIMVNAGGVKQLISQFRDSAYRDTKS